MEHYKATPYYKINSSNNPIIRFNQAEIRKQEHYDRLCIIFFGLSLVILVGITVYVTLYIEARL